jgi:CheY-like chemotaxis protein
MRVTTLQTTVDTPAQAIVRPWMTFVLPAIGLALTGYFASAVPGNEGPARLLLWVALGIAAMMPAIVVHFHLLRFQGHPGAVARIDPTLGQTASFVAEPMDPMPSSVLMPAACDLAGVAEKVREAVKDVVRRKGLGLDIVVDSRILQPVIADAHHLARALTNLAVHAAETTDHGGVTVRITMIDPSMSGYLLRFSVEDTGAGISRDLQARLFGPLERRPASGHASDDVSGLSTARTLTDLMGGRLRVSSDPGVGSRFWFDLRLPLSAEPIGGVATGDIPMAGPKRVLVADANPTSLHLLREALANDGHEVSTADCGALALDLLQASEEWDVVLLDADLPDMSAETLAQTCRFGASKPASIHLLDAPVDTDEVRRMVEAAASRRRMDSDDATMPILRAVPIVYIDEDTIGRLAAISTQPDFLAELIAQAIAGIERNSRELAAALDAGEFERVRDAAHALDAIARDVGAIRLARLASSIMRRNAGELETRRQRLVDELRETASHTVATLEMLPSRWQPANTGTTG